MAWPATPKVSGKGTSAMASQNTSIGMGSVQLSSKSKTIAGDSSPASTYGETAIGESVPATPNEPAGRPGEGPMPTLNPLLADNPMDHLWAEEASFIKPSVEDVAKLLGASLISASSSSSDSPWEHEPSVKRVASSESVKAHVTPMASFDKDLGYDSEGKSRNDFRKKHSVHFIKGETDSHDPFVCDDGVPVKEGGFGKSLSPTAGGEMTIEGTGSPESKIYRPRGDRATHEISADNAQAILPPSSCVFIANLSNSLSDSELQRAVENVFCEFGTVYVKIKRDARGMPFAFAQYENVTSAERAIDEGRGLVIHGRQCRTERAKVNRSLYLSAANGNFISQMKAYEILEGYGDLEKVWHCSNTERQMYNLPEGIWVTFAFFQDARDAQNKFKENPQYHLENYDHSGGSRGGSSLRSNASPMSICAGIQPVEVTGLPATASPEHVRGLFDQFGKKCVTLIEISTRKSSANLVDTTAIVHFNSQHVVDKVMQGGLYSLGGHRLTLKTSKTGSPEFSRRPQGAIYSGSPFHRRRTASRPYQTPMARALALGCPPDFVTALFDENAGAMPYNGAYSNMGAYYSFNGFQAAPYASYGMPGPNNSTAAMYQSPSSMNPGTAMVPSYGAPYYAMLQSPYYPAQPNGAATTSDNPAHSAEAGWKGEPN